ncbi:hypothetical protein X739_28795 [Mesorhizobium sp. LNHC220B00]|nr:hypothetical protein [Mesorhizobium sp. LNHC220B00]ESY80733.1 hypothetical protein X739_28795 [Mesorhizobium sp. LNHC220B00]
MRVEGGKGGIGIVRVSLFTAIGTIYAGFLLNAGDVATWYQEVSAAGYQPKGLVRLFSTAPPPVWFVELISVLAGISTALAIVGLLTRPAMVFSILSVLFLQSLTYSFRFGWSHTYNVIFLAGLAFMFGRAGDSLSLDASLRRRPLPTSTNYQWPILLGQAMIALFYFGAGYAKVAGEDHRFNLDWVFSDSLRNMVIQPWFVADRPLPGVVEMFASHPVLWQGAALGHLAVQFSPILACLFIHRPILRLIEGVAFALGVVLLGVFMGYWNLAWLLLVPFFVDWDYFLAGAAPVAAKATPGPVVIAWSCVLVLAITATFVFRLGYEHFLYPFSNFDFFSGVNAEPPLSEHRPWHQDIGEISLVTDEGETFIQPENLTLIGRYRGQDRLDIDSSIYQKRGLVLAAALTELSREEWVTLGSHASFRPGSGSIREVRFGGVTVLFPAYPHRPTWETVFRGLLGVYVVRDHTLRLANGNATVKGGELELIKIQLSGFQSPQIRMYWVHDPWRATEPEEPISITGTFDSRESVFAPAPGQQLPWGALTLIDVQDGGKRWRFIGPTVTW